MAPQKSNRYRPVRFPVAEINRALPRAVVFGLCILTATIDGEVMLQGTYDAANLADDLAAARARVAALEEQQRTFMASTASELSETQQWGQEPESFRSLVPNRSISWCQVANLSMLSASGCSGHEATESVLVTGTGRSGTKYASAVFNKLGFAMSHDNKIGCPCPNVDGAVSWVHAFAMTAPPHKARFETPSSCTTSAIVPKWTWKPWADNDKARKIKRFRSVVHLVRSPLESILSRFNNGTAKIYYETSACHTALGDDILQNSLAVPLRHWVLWNLFVEAHTSLRIRSDYLLEDWIYGGKCAKAFNFNDTRCKPTPKILAKVKRLQKTINAEHTIKATDVNISWHLLSQVDPTFAVMAQRMALRYGFTVEPTDILSAALDKSLTERCFIVPDGRWSCDLRLIHDQQSISGPYHRGLYTPKSSKAEITTTPPKMIVRVNPSPSIKLIRKPTTTPFVIGSKRHMLLDRRQFPGGINGPSVVQVKPLHLHHLPSPHSAIIRCIFHFDLKLVLSIIAR